MGFLKELFSNLFGEKFNERMKAVDNLTKAINNGEGVVDKKSLEIRKNDKKEEK